MEFTPFEQKTIEALEECKGAVKNCSKHAVTHLEKAWAIREIDLEMAVFRGITAEEEAASALFYCLKIRRYTNADKLMFRKHTYKLGLFPFLLGIQQFLGNTLGNDNGPFEKFSVKHIEKSGRKALELILKFKDRDLVARPTPPLHFNLSEHESGNAVTFSREFERLYDGERYSDSLKYIKDIAGKRNRILYADSSGRPQVDGDIGKYLTEQKRKVFIILSIVLLIDPWEKEEGHSSFVQQALDSFLLLLQRINHDEMVQPDNGMLREDEVVEERAD